MMFRTPSTILNMDVVVPGAVPGMTDLAGEPEDTTPVDLGTLTLIPIQPSQH